MVGIASSQVREGHGRLLHSSVLAVVSRQKCGWGTSNGACPVCVCVCFRARACVRACSRRMCAFACACVRVCAFACARVVCIPVCLVLQDLGSQGQGQRFGLNVYGVRVQGYIWFRV